nr:MAG TPA: hypothetical protein [Bacteriophage sp.]
MQLLTRITSPQIFLSPKKILYIFLLNSVKFL